MSSNSRISTTIDLDSAGRQLGYYRIPHSDDTQPAGHQGPIIVLANGEGPTLLLTGGVHGDEYAGPVALMRLAQDLSLSELSGRLIVIPALNAPAIGASSRCSPLDGGNMNRAFPGDPDGGPTAMIAHWVESVILPQCDAAIDFHAGGKVSDYEPLVMVNRSPGDLFERNMALVQAFGLELVWIMGSLNDNRSVNAAAERVGVPMFACEIGGKGESNPAMTACAYEGARGVMRHLGMLKSDPEPAPTELRLVEVTNSDCSVVAPHGGLFDPVVEIGVEVETGELAGWVRDPFEITRPPTAVHFGTSGHLAIRCARGYVTAGEKLFGVVTDYKD